MLTRYRSSLLSLCALVAVAAAPPASAQRITRCVDPGSGNVTYADHKCVAVSQETSGDGPCYRQAEIAMKEQARYAPGTHTERARAIGGPVRATPDVVAPVVRNSLSARCRAVLEKQGPNGPEWYGPDAWSKLRTEATARRLARAALSAELGQQLHAILETARRAYEIVMTGGPDEAFALQVQATRQQQESLRTRYVPSLQMDDHKPLGLAVSQACAALFALDSDLRNERDSAATLATAKETVVQYREMRHLSVPARTIADEVEQWLVRVEQAHDQARTRLASRIEELGHTLAEAMRVAADDRRPAGGAIQPVHALEVP